MRNLPVRANANQAGARAFERCELAAAERRKPHLSAPAPASPPPPPPPPPRRGPRGTSTPSPPRRILVAERRARPDAQIAAFARKRSFFDDPCATGRAPDTHRARTPEWPCTPRRLVLLRSGALRVAGHLQGPSPRALQVQARKRAQRKHSLSRPGMSVCARTRWSWRQSRCPRRWCRASGLYTPARSTPC